MKYVFSESLKDAYREHGQQGIMNLWARTMIDAGKSLVAQHLENQQGASSMKTNSNDLIMQNKVFLWIALATGFVLLIPLIAMQFTNEVVWTPLDFATMGTLLFGAGSIFVLGARKTGNTAYRASIGIVLAAVFLYLWVELAVGIFTNWGS